MKEETSIHVTEWDRLAYTTLVQFRNGNRDLDLNVEIHLAKEWQGTFDCSNDPDGLVEDAIFIDMLSAGDLYLGDDYISEPKLEWALSQWDHPVNFAYLDRPAQRSPLVSAIVVLATDRCVVAFSGNGELMLGLVPELLVDP